MQGRLHKLSVLKAAGPGTGVWPSAGFLRAAEPQLVLWPQETTYPPEVSEYLTTQVTAARVEADGIVEVVSDGRRFWVVRHSAVRADAANDEQSMIVQTGNPSKTAGYPSGFLALKICALRASSEHPQSPRFPTT
jgi:hypothetical protein